MDQTEYAELEFIDEPIYMALHHFVLVLIVVV